jgi:hypothetical protein
LARKENGRVGRYRFFFFAFPPFFFAGMSN